jgi:hypothetical protein
MSPRSLLALLALSLGACQDVRHRDDPQTRPYGTGDLTLLARYTAKESCSCLFVMGMSESFCRSYTKASPSVASWKVVREAKAVEASALVLWRAKARFVDDEVGCALE